MGAQDSCSDTSQPEQTRVLAIILLSRSGQAKSGSIEELLDSPRPWLRRAAYRALGAEALASRIDKLLRDESAVVRAVVPFLASPHNNGWLHWFDDSSHVHDYEDLGGDGCSSGPNFRRVAQNPVPHRPVQQT